MNFLKATIAFPEIRNLIENNMLTAIEQISYLLFMKRIDDLDLKKKADAEFTGDPYTSKFKGI